MRKNQQGWIGAVFGILGGLIVVAGIIGLIFVSVYYATNKHDVTFTVTDKQSINDQNGHKYLIFGDKTTYENTDSWLNNKFNSSDLYGQIKIGKTYKCTAVGFRNGFSSSYENLITCEEQK